MQRGWTSSVTMLNSEGSEGCSGWVDSEVVGLSRRVHAWSLVIVVESMIAAIVVIVVLLPLVAHLFLMCLEPRVRNSQRCV